MRAAASLDGGASAKELAGIERFREASLRVFDEAGIFRPGAVPTAAVNPDLTEDPVVGAEPRPLEQILGELDALVGLGDVKREVHVLANTLRIQQMRVERGLPTLDMSHHVVFSGNPGTGKTTVARLLSEVMHTLGIVSKGHLVETDRSGLVAGYVGQTAVKTRAVLESAVGGTLLIDEAYALVRASTNDFGQEAIDTLVKFMEDHREDLTVIAAGYPEEMNALMASNPGLASRFTQRLRFPDYTDEELVHVFERLCRRHHYAIADDRRPDRVHRPVRRPALQVVAAPPLPGLHLVMVETQEVEALLPLGETDDPGLVGMQPQPERDQDFGHTLSGLFGFGLCGTEHDKVVGVPDQHPETPSVALPDLIEDVQRDVGEQWRDGRTLRGAGVAAGHYPTLEHPRSKPASQQLQHRPVRHPSGHLDHQGIVIDLVEARFDVGVEHPLAAPIGLDPDHLDGIMGRTFRSETETDRLEIGLENWFEDQLGGRHDQPVRNSGNAQRPGLPRLAWLGNVDSSQRCRPIRSGPQRPGEPIEELAHPGSFDGVDGQPINARSSRLVRTSNQALHMMSLRATLS